MTNRGKIWKYDKETGKCYEVGSKDDPLVIHYIQEDTIPPTESYATDERKIFTSRSALYRHYKEHGFECTGGSHLTGRDWTKHKYEVDRADLEKDIEISLNQLKWGSAPLTEKEKEACLREEREYQAYKKRQ